MLPPHQCCAAALGGTAMTRRARPRITAEITCTASEVMTAGTKPGRPPLSGESLLMPAAGGSSRSAWVRMVTSVIFNFKGFLFRKKQRHKHTQGVFARGCLRHLAAFFNSVGSVVALPLTRRCDNREATGCDRRPQAAETANLFIQLKTAVVVCCLGKYAHRPGHSARDQ